tara:strand:+ start:300 stop:803 length:504 start_codon:yes stop_codon:yes gene_type:complete
MGIRSLFSRGYIDIWRFPNDGEKVGNLRFVSKSFGDIVNVLHSYLALGNVNNIFYDDIGALRNRVERKKQIDLDFTFDIPASKDAEKIELELDKGVRVTLGPLGLDRLLGQVHVKKRQGNRVDKLYSWECAPDSKIFVPERLNKKILEHNWGQYVADSYLIDEAARK